MSSVEVRPSVQELSREANTSVKCPIAGCGKIFSQSAAFRMHRVKVHKILEGEQDLAILHRRKAKDKVNSIYFCPIQECKFNKRNNFRCFKYLKQHFMKVHAEKKFCCDICGICFGVMSTLRTHQLTCGQMFHCGECNCPFSTVEALKQHFTDTKHSQPVWSSSSCNDSAEKLNSQCHTGSNHFKHQVPGPTTVNVFVFNVSPMLPPSSSCHTVTTNTDNFEVQPPHSLQSNDLNTCCTGTQTKKQRFKAVSIQTTENYNEKKLMQNTVAVGTRKTGSRKRKAESVAVADFDILKSNLPSCENILQSCNYDLMNSETQTMALLEEFEATLAQHNSTQTQESFLSNSVTNLNQNIETQTLSSVFSSYASTDTPWPGQSSLFSTEFENGDNINWTDEWESSWNTNNQQTSTDGFSSHIQTQTIDTMFDQILSNMETQTGDDLMLPRFSSMSCETQTHLLGMQSPLHVQSADTETQTFFPNINLNDTVTDSHTQTCLNDLELLFS